MEQLAGTQGIEEQTIEAQTIEEQRAILGRILGLQEAVSEDVLTAAVADSTYAHNLLVARGRSKYLDYLLSHPPKMDSSDDFSSGELMRRAGASLFRWARTGFSKVAEDRYRKRLEACHVCPNLRKPSENKKELYRLTGADVEKALVCGKCGCVVEEKARRVSDTCPDAHPQIKGLNRWEEPLVK